MKKIKLLTPLVALTSLATIGTSLTACNNNPGSSSGDIEITKHDNITVTCSKIEKGQDLVINFSLSSNYGIDMAKSKITFADSNGSIMLYDDAITIDTKAKTITVAGSSVTSTTVTIDLYAANNSILDNFTASDYTAAKNWLITESTSRKFISSSNAKMINKTTGAIDEEADYALVFNGDKTYMKLNTYTGQTSVPNEMWFEKRETIGYDAYANYKSSGKKIMMPLPQNDLSLDLEEIFATLDFSKFTKDYTQNVFTWTSEHDETICMAVNSNKQITYLYSWYPAFTLTDNLQTKITFTYSSETITMPTGYEQLTWTDNTNPDLYTTSEEEGIEGLEYTLKTSETPNIIVGEFLIPLENYTASFDPTLGLTISFDNGGSNLYKKAVVAVDDTPLETTDFTINQSTGAITINPNKYAADSEVRIVYGGGTNEYSSVTPTKLYVQNEAE